MKSKRYFPLSKPRRVTRVYDMMEENNVMIDDVQSSQFSTFDLTPKSFTIGDLNPIKTKKFSNLDTLPFGFQTDYDVLVWASALISESPTGNYLLEMVRDCGWRLGLSDLGTGGFHLNIDDKVIEIDNFGFEPQAIGQSSYYRLALLPVLAKALRDITHEENFGAFDQNYCAEAVLQMERARAADTDSVAILIGYELRAAGYDSIWRHMLSSDDGDMAQVLTNILDRYPTALYNGMALAHVFRQWYADMNRIDAIDHDTLEHLDLVLAAGQDIKGTRKVTHKDIENLSLLPDGEKYLKELGDTVAKDPFFCGLNDPINQAHLFQIIYDNQVTYVENVPFRDASLARKFS